MAKALDLVAKLSRRAEFNTMNDNLERVHSYCFKSDSDIVWELEYRDYDDLIVEKTTRIHDVRFTYRNTDVSKTYPASVLEKCIAWMMSKRL